MKPILLLVIPILTTAQASQIEDYISSTNNPEGFESLEHLDRVIRESYPASPLGCTLYKYPESPSAERDIILKFPIIKIIKKPATYGQ